MQLSLRRQKLELAESHVGVIIKDFRARRSHTPPASDWHKVTQNLFAENISISTRYRQIKSYESWLAENQLRRQWFISYGRALAWYRNCSSTRDHDFERWLHSHFTLEIMQFMGHNHHVILCLKGMRMWRSTSWKKRPYLFLLDETKAEQLFPPAAASRQ